MGQRPGAAAIGELPTKIDMLTVQVATILWRLGDAASVREMAPFLAIAQGKSARLTAEEQVTLEAEIAISAAMRTSRGLATVIEWLGADEWALTETGRRILSVAGTPKDGRLRHLN